MLVTRKAHFWDFSLYFQFCKFIISPLFFKEEFWVLEVGRCWQEEPQPSSWHIMSIMSCHQLIHLTVSRKCTYVCTKMLTARIRIVEYACLLFLIIYFVFLSFYVCMKLGIIYFFSTLILIHDDYSNLTWPYYIKDFFFLLNISHLDSSCFSSLLQAHSWP